MYDIVLTLKESGAEMVISTQRDAKSALHEHNELSRRLGADDCPYVAVTIRKRKGGR